MAIGARIHSLRLQMGLTLPQLAEKAGVSIGLLSQLENALKEEANPNLQTIRKIATALNTTIGDLLERPIKVARQIVPEKLDAGLQEFLQRAKRSDETLHEGVIQGLFAMQERNGAPKTAQEWEFLYRTIKMNFDSRNSHGASRKL
jgi:transcriptional regulator with XRE-family HTH domain